MKIAGVTEQVEAERHTTSQGPHMSQQCSECRVNWWPYQAEHGRCPTCGGATVRSEEPASDDADTLYRVAHGEAAIRDAYANIDLYYADREDERRAA
ncbi:MAG: hypothetical protein ACRDLN_00465 [Solirubrobacteraceae bacterium]